MLKGHAGWGQEAAHLSLGSSSLAVGNGGRRKKEPELLRRGGMVGSSR